MQERLSKRYMKGGGEGVGGEGVGDGDGVRGEAQRPERPFCGRFLSSRRRESLSAGSLL